MWKAVNVLRLAMQVYEEHNITARPHNSFEDQQMCDLLVQILDNQDFFPDVFIETIGTLDILDHEYEGPERIDQPPDSEEDVPVSRPSSDDEQSSHSSYHPSPKKRSKENVKMEDRQQAVQYWLTKVARSVTAWLLCENDFALPERQLYRLKRQEAPLPLTKKTIHNRLYAEFTDARQNKPSLRTRGMWKKTFNSMFVVQIEKKKCFEHAIDTSHFCGSYSA
jgi:hypothetical protein